MKSIYIVVRYALCTHMCVVGVYRFNLRRKKKEFNWSLFFWRQKEKSITERVTGNWDSGVIFYIIEFKREMWRKWNV